MPHVGTVLPDDLRSRYAARAVDVEDTDWHLDEVYALRARARREPAAAAPFALRDRPQPAARERADVPRRQQHRAVPDALLHRRRRCTATARRPTTPRSPRAASATGGRTTTRSKAELARLQAAHGHVVLFDAHSIKSELPWLFEGRLPDLNLGTADGTQLRARPARRAGAGAGGAATLSATSSTAASRAATSRATTAGRPPACHAVQLEMSLALLHARGAAVRGRCGATRDAAADRCAR